MFKIKDVRKPDEILDSAFRRANKVTVQKGKKVAAAKGLSIGKTKTASQYIANELGSYISSFPSLNELREFYRELIDITVGLDELKHNLGAIDRCRKVTTSIGTESVRKIKRMSEANRINAERKAAYGKISSVVKKAGKNLAFLEDARKKLKNLPAIDVDAPTVVIAGSPNVGKSQLVGRLSSARPKVATYPFTTKNISIGIFEEKYRRYQVIDTPGLLDRPYAKRNNIEKQAISALKHLASVIVFVIDPTETCGYSVKDQLNLLETIKKDFEMPILEVENKADILRTESERIKVSALSGKGIEGLRIGLVALLKKED
jgi:nucleolar GTP-binding protein